MQGDDGWTQGPGPPPHGRYDRKKNPHRKGVIVIRRQYLPKSSSPRLFIRRRDPSAGAGGGRGRVWPGGASDETVSRQ